MKPRDVFGVLTELGKVSLSSAREIEWIAARVTLHDTYVWRSCKHNSYYLVTMLYYPLGFGISVLRWRKILTGR